MAQLEPQIVERIRASIEAKTRLLHDADFIASIAQVSTLIITCFRGGGKVLLFGNGGSAADAQHIAAEFVGRFAFNRPALPAMALTANTSALTAIGNDYGYDQTFSRQVEAFARNGDVAIGISTSGGSPNVLAGLAAARKTGVHTVGLTGQNSDKMRAVCDFCISVPAIETPRVQECHVLVGHIICEIAESAMFQQHRATAQ